MTAQGEKSGLDEFETGSAIGLAPFEEGAGILLDELSEASPGVLEEIDFSIEPFRLSEMLGKIPGENGIEEEGEPPWPPLSPRYAAWKAAHGGGKIMHLTGALERSLRKGALHGIYRLEKFLLEIGTGLMVGKYNLGLIHQKPITAPVPPRPTMRISPKAQTKGIMIFRDWLSEKGRKAGVRL